MKFRVILFSVAASLLLLVRISPLEAAWSPNGDLMCGEAEYQVGPRIVSDGAGGMILAWRDERHFRLDVYAQRSDGSGNMMWADGGIALTDTRDYYDNLIDLVTDGAGGAIAVWYDQDRDELTASRIGPDGTKLWGETGKVIGTLDVPYNVVVAPDGSGGALIAWAIQMSDQEPYVQKLDNDGNELWTANGLQYSTRMLDDSRPDIADDGAGGALIAFTEAVAGEHRVMAQRVYANGSLWTAPGINVSYRAIGPMSPGYFPSITRDGAGGAFVAWQVGESGSAVLVRNVDAGGNLPWTEPLFVSLAAGGHRRPDIISDGLGGACIVWENNRNPSYDVYAQRLDAFGTRLWAPDGVPICEAVDDQIDAVILARSSQDITIAWVDERGGATGPVKSLYAQKVDFGGAVQWPANGVHVITGIADLDYGFATDGSGGMMAAIGDDRSLGTGADIYAQSINSFGNAASPEPVMTNISDVPGDQGGNVRIMIARSDRDHLGQTFEPVATYDVWQRIDDPAAVSKVLTLSAHKERIPGAGSVTMLASESRRFVVSVDKGAFPQGIWEFIGGFGASQTDEYVFRASTLADSNDAGISYSVFAVAARTTNPFAWFVSAPDSGYSVDNLAPAAPKNLVAAYGTSSHSLSWDENIEQDFQFYRVYRGDHAGFLPTPSDLVYTTASAGWIDSSDPGYEVHYLVSAVDANGNEGPPSAPGTITGTGDFPGRRQFALHSAVPNPFNPRTTISFELASTVAHLRLEIYDVSGRLVSVLGEGNYGSGRHELIWEATDRRGHALASGVYLYRLRAGEFTATKRMTLVR